MTGSLRMGLTVRRRSTVRSTMPSDVPPTPWVANRSRAAVTIRACAALSTGSTPRRVSDCLWRPSRTATVAPPSRSATPGAGAVTTPTTPTTDLYYEPHDFWAVSRFDDVQRGLVERETFSSARGAVLEFIKANIEIPPGIFIF